MNDVAIRGYERIDADLKTRLSSLARRFPSLQTAAGTDPWNPDELLSWTQQCSDEAGRQSALLLLAMAGAHATASFDLIAAMRCWSEADRQTFVDLLRVWNF